MESDGTKEWGVTAEHLAFIERFKTLNGRPPVVLAIGNIANNALKNALILRRQGIECDVICYDYYHVMGCPEWECADFSTRDLDFNGPAWSQVDVGEYRRPRWFVQGRLSTCLDYVLAMREGRPEADQLWEKLRREIDTKGAGNDADPMTVSDDEVEVGLRRLRYLFSSYFPHRALAFDFDDLALKYAFHFQLAPKWRAVLDKYDCVIGYATDGLYPLAFRKQPYISFEHGTIRTFPFEETTFGQLCALTYAHASDTLVTNCDNIVSAQKLQLRSYRFVPHPMEEVYPGETAIRLRDELRTAHDADFIVFHPSRQHWSSERNLNWEKGNDFLIEGFARFAKSVRPKALLVMVEWGQTVAQSKDLIRRLSIEDRVVWIEPLTVPGVGRYIAASDALADQFVIGAWGAVMPHGLMLGVPTLIHVNESVHRWCFPEMPPILNVRTADEIASALVSLANPAVAAGYRTAGPAWYRKYHSEDVVAGRLLDSLRHSLSIANLHDPVRKMAELEAAVLAGFEARRAPDRLRQLNFATRQAAQRVASRLLRMRARFPVVGGAVFAIARAIYRTAGALARFVGLR